MKYTTKSPLHSLSISSAICAFSFNFLLNPFAFAENNEKSNRTSEDTGNSVAVEKIKPANPSKAKQLTREGKSVLQDGLNEQARAKFEEAIQADPSFMDAHLGRGQVLYKEDKLYAALQELKLVLSKQPNSPEAWLAIGRVYQKMDKLASCIDAYKRFVSLAPQNNEESPKYSALLGILEQQLKEQQLKEQKRDTDGTSNYLALATQQGMYKWPQSRIPITVFVKPANNLPGYKEVYDDLLRQSFEEWASASNSKLDFTFVDTPEKALLTCTWTNDLHAPALTAEAGKAEVQEDGEGIDAAQVLLLTVSPFPDEPLTNYLLHNVCLHEIGHALGLIGHSNNPDDIMYPSLFLQRGISASDKNTLLSLYSDDAQALVSKAEASSTTSQSPALTKDKLLHEGSRAACSGDFLLAIEKLQAVLKIDPNNALARQNLAVAANNLAIKQEDPKESIRFLHKALYWDPSSKLSRDNLNIYLQNMSLDPNNFAQRVKFGDQCNTQKDYIGAIIEYSEALKIHPDPTIQTRLNAAKKILATLAH